MAGSTYDVTYDGSDFGYIKSTGTYTREWTWFIEDEMMIAATTLGELKQLVTFYLHEEES
jgi:hypothetical protein